MDTFRVGLRLTYRCIITAISLAMMYSVFVALQREPNPVAQALLLTVGLLAFAAAAAAWSRGFAALYVQLCAIPILAALYLFELGHRDPIDEMLHIEQQWRLAKSKAASGQPFTIQISPDNFTRIPNGSLDLPSGERVFPLGQVADLPTIMCREGARPFAEFEADERGFNNPKGNLGQACRPPVHWRFYDLWRVPAKPRSFHGASSGAFSFHAQSWRRRNWSARRARSDAGICTPDQAEIHIFHV